MRLVYVQGLVWEWERGTGQVISTTPALNGHSDGPEMSISTDSPVSGHSWDGCFILPSVHLSLKHQGHLLPCANREPRSPACFVIMHSDHWWSEHEERVNEIYLWEIKWASVGNESHHSGMVPALVDRPLLHSGHLWVHRHPMTPHSSARELPCTGLDNRAHPIQPSCNGSQRICVKIKSHCKVSIRDTLFEGKHFSYSEVEWKRRLYSISQTLGMGVSHPLHVTWHAGLQRSRDFKFNGF